MSYADVLRRKQLVKAAVEKTASDITIQLESDRAQQRVMWMAVVALNSVFGFGEKRAIDFLIGLQSVAEEMTAITEKHGAQYAVDKLRQQASKITGIDIKYIHEEEFAEARRRNEAQGIFFEREEP